MEVKFKKLHPDAVTPSYAKEGDAGLDLVAVSNDLNEDTLLQEMGTGIAVEIPTGFVGLIYPRSSITKQGTRLANCVGVVDSGYRGEIKFKFDLSPINVLSTTMDNMNHKGAGDLPSLHGYEIGDKIGQLIITPIPTITLKEVTELSDSERGKGGFGSTGK